MGCGASAACGWIAFSRAPRPSVRGAGWGSFRWGLLLCALLLVASPAFAKPCGDDVAGVDVPCSCGDLVVSDVTLGADPVVQGTCPGDGLTVRASERDGVRVDLAGHTLRGSGAGRGIWVVHGGRNGAEITSSGARATVAGFRDGVVAQGGAVLASLSNIAVDDSRRDGINVRGRDFAIRDIEVRRAGRDGLSVDGHAFDLAQVSVYDSKRHGIVVGGRGGALASADGKCLARRSGAAGIVMRGRDHVLDGCRAEASQGTGIKVAGTGHQVRNGVAHEGAGDGIHAAGVNLRLSGNAATQNGGNGIKAGGPGTQDQGGNRGAGNGTASEEGPVVQCQIARQPCAP